MATPPPSANLIQQRVWAGQVPLKIVLSPSESRRFDQTDPYIISVSRLSYLPFLLPRLLAFFSSSLIDPDVESHHGWFSFEGVPLRWHYPVGLLYDLYAGADPVTSRTSLTPDSESELRLYRSTQPPDDEGGEARSSSSSRRSKSKSKGLPWTVSIHFHDWPDQDLIRLDAEGKVLHDAFVNSVKEADFLRNGTAKQIMTLSKQDSSGLWKSVEEHDLPAYQRIHNTLLVPSTPFRNIPIRIFLPSPPDSSVPALRVIQSPVPPLIIAPPSPPVAIASSASASAPAASRPAAPQTQTIGTALHALLPSLFPSKRIPMLAKPVLHGAVVPMNAPVEEIVRCAGYADGWLGVVISMIG
ncbi:Autophagy protein 5 [Ophidiomyces ophidiicola]|nr:Autophagy protein 5 [Ophidiomyces ophidiicola]KAI1911154.1 Autophagy protein 5 [Ophidiomyces ophidiicola]KAI1920763.1 Autophagy protein 5 [Ophidiomyces ophidiicola]KAI1963813.1 Autophagy protein 5 [Ophidiomyces ophidiicola]KAI2004153.1 Autophagy protein 5 [Ophidiomyces ophidiicola]